MKKTVLIFCALAGAMATHAQGTWNTSGSTVLTTTNGYVGIGTTSPTTWLHVLPDFTGAPLVPAQQSPVVNFAYIDQSSTAHNLFQLSYDGRLGLGTTTPSDLLHLENGGLYVNNGNMNMYGGELSMFSNSSVKNFKVDVNGNVWARHFTVLTSPIPDYVFEKNYSLMSLAELEQYITRNKHLPNIPSAKEYEAASGVDMGELQMKLLEKVEELTLHIIDLNKKLEQQQALINQLQQNK